MLEVHYGSCIGKRWGSELVMLLRKNLNENFWLAYLLTPLTVLWDFFLAWTCLFPQTGNGNTLMTELLAVTVQSDPVCAQHVPSFLEYNLLATCWAINSVFVSTSYSNDLTPFEVKIRTQCCMSWQTLYVEACLLRMSNRIWGRWNAGAYQ